MKTIKGFAVLLAVFFFMAALPFSASGSEAAKSGGLVALFGVSHGFISFKLVDAATRASITKAKIETTVISPDGKKIKVDLESMKMDKDNTFMNAAPLQLKDIGEYTYNFSVVAGKKKGHFSFKSSVR